MQGQNWNNAKEKQINQLGGLDKWYALRAEKRDPFFFIYSVRNK